MWFSVYSSSLGYSATYIYLLYHVHLNSLDQYGICTHLAHLPEESRSLCVSELCYLQSFGILGGTGRCAGNTLIKTIQVHMVEQVDVGSWVTKTTQVNKVPVEPWIPKQAESASYSLPTYLSFLFVHLKGHDHLNNCIYPTLLSEESPAYSYACSTL